jgi:hypothetical protein
MATTDLIVRLIGNTDGLRKDLGKATGILNGFKRTIGTVGASLGLAFGGAAVIRAIGTSIKKIADFEEQMDTVAAVSRASSKEIEQLTKNALDLGAKSKFTATQIGSMQESLARLGFTSNQIINTTEAVRKLATAAGEELAPSAEIMAGTLKSFNLQAGESERVANVMAEAFSTTALNLEKFGAGMSNVGAVAETTGRSLEFTSAALGTLVDRNIDASKAGTDLRKIFIELAAKGLTLEEGLNKIRTSTDKVTTAVNLFDVRAAASAIILSDNEEKVNALAESYGDLNTELDSMVATMEDNLNTDLKLMTSALDGVIQKGSALNGVFRTTIQLMTLMLGGDVKRGFFDVAGLGADELTTRIGNLNFQIEQTDQKFKRGILTTEEYQKEMFLLNSTLDVAIERLIKLSTESGEADKGLNSFAETLAKLGSGDVFGKLADEIVIPKGIIEEVNEQLKEAELNAKLAFNTTLLGKYNREISLLKERLEELNKVGTRPAVSDPTETLKSKGVADKSPFEKQIEGVNKYRESLKKASETIQMVKLDLEEVAIVAQNQFAVAFEKIGGVFLNTGAIMREFASSILVGFAEDLGNALSGVGSFGDNIIKAVSSFMRQLGEQMIQLGVAKALLDKLGAALPGGVLIAAGVALVAASSLISNTFGQGIGGASGGGGFSSSGSTNGAYRTSGIGDFRDQTIQVGGEFRLEGNTLVAAISKAQRNKGLIG